MVIDWKQFHGRLLLSKKQHELVKLKSVYVKKYGSDLCVH